MNGAMQLVIQQSIRLARPLATGLLDLLAPHFCAACGLESHRNLGLCEACESDLPWLPAACGQCAIPLPGDNPLCGRCLKNPPAFDATVPAALFVEPVSGFVHGFKDNGRFHLGVVLVELLAQSVADHIGEHGSPDLVIPMPLHWSRRWRRGFNQAALLAGGLSRHSLLRDLKLTVDDRLCKRRRATPSQRALSAVERAGNLAGAFECRHRVEGQRVAIVDDVVTTGASAGAQAT